MAGEGDLALSKPSYSLSLGEHIFLPRITELWEDNHVS